LKGAYWAAFGMVGSFAGRGRALARVVGGDTVATASGEKVRLMHFDAPEIHGECPQERELARQATAFRRHFAGSGRELERRGRDRCGRTLAATTLIRASLAHPYEGRGPRGGWCVPGP
jgi:endonuclease YncB( thermonuclease family)